jgi:S-adenosyl methyltransferase
MVFPVNTAGEQDVRDPSLASIHDYWLGGRHHSALDRDYADRIAMVVPHIPYLVRAERALLGRMVRYLAGQGVRQFLDLGSGMPTRGHVHEIAQGVDAASRVVYVDSDPGVVACSDRLLAGNEHATLVCADIREPSEVLNAPETRRLLDLDEPTAVLVISTLQHISDSDDPFGMVAAYRDALSPGGYLAVSHLGPDEDLVVGQKLFDQMHLGERPRVTVRGKDLVVGMFSGLELVPPGIVPVLLWRPDPDDEIGRNPERHPMCAGVGRKP